MLASLEMLTSEDTMLAIVRRLLIQHRYRNFRLENFIELLRPLLVDNIDLGQVWAQNIDYLNYLNILFLGLRFLVQKWRNPKPFGRKDGGPSPFGAAE
jgi:hypothetical protein